MTRDDAVIKERPEDFLVRENMVVRLASKGEATHRYLLMRKCGYTTMEACRLIAEALSITSNEVTYGGLKDEDAITEQLIGVPIGALAQQAETLTIGPGGTVRWLELQHYGYGTGALEIGTLEGNGFRLVIRNLGEDALAPFCEGRQLSTFFLNYYDIQRFGVPGGPKRTHLVGIALLGQRWDEALQRLIELRAPESDLADAWTGSAREFFRQLDSRTVSFYLAAHGSHEFNRALAELVERRCPNNNQPIQVEGIPYLYVDSPRVAASVVTEAASLPYARYGFSDGVCTKRSSRRATVIQASINIVSVGTDDFHEGRHKVAVRFFLPSGCYATAAIRQLMTYRNGSGEE